MLSMKYMLIFLFVVSSYGQQGQQKASDVIINNEQVSVPSVNEVATNSISKTTLPQAVTTITKSQSATTPDVEIYPHSPTTDASPISTPTATPPSNLTTTNPIPTTPKTPTTPTPTNGTTTSTETPITTPTTNAPTTSVKPTDPSTITPSTISPTNKTTLHPNITTTALPVTTSAPPNNRRFDGPSFIGGIVLASGLVAIGFIAFKFYKARTELNYHTL